MRASTALAAASEAGDNWAIGWALHVLTIVTAVQGQLTDALPLFEATRPRPEGLPAQARQRRPRPPRPMRSPSWPRNSSASLLAIGAAPIRSICAGPDGVSVCGDTGFMGIRLARVAELPVDLS